MTRTLEDLSREELAELQFFWNKKLNNRAEQDMSLLRRKEKLDEASAAEMYLQALAVAVSGIAYAGDDGSGGGEKILGNIYKFMLQHYHHAKAELDGTMPAGRA